MQPDLQQVLNRINDLYPSSWRDPGFWIAQIISVAGLIFSILAFRRLERLFAKPEVLRKLQPRRAEPSKFRPLLSN